MKACIGNGHQLVLKIVKQLDDLMIRDYQSFPLPEDIMNYDIPKPTFSTYGEDDQLSEEEPEAVYFPSLSSVCTDMISRNLDVENAIDTYERSDNL